MTLVECHPPVQACSLDGSVVRVEWNFVAGANERAAHSNRSPEGRLVLTASFADGAARVSAWSEVGGARRSLLLDVAATATVSRLNGHVHLELTAAPEHSESAAREASVLSMVLQGDRAIYLRSELPERAGLLGGTYDLVAAQLRAGR